MKMSEKSFPIGSIKFRTKTSRHWLAKIDWHFLQRFTIWYNEKHQRRAHFSRMSIVLGQLNELRTGKDGGLSECGG
jgi:hypothetical protein